MDFLVGAVWTSEPVFTPPFSSGLEPLSGFLEYLAGKGKVKVGLECHSLTRSDKDGYKVSNTERVGFRTRDFYTIALSCGRPSPTEVHMIEFSRLVVSKGQPHKFCTRHLRIPH